MNAEQFSNEAILKFKRGRQDNSKCHRWRAAQAFVHAAEKGV